MTKMNLEGDAPVPMGADTNPAAKAKEAKGVSPEQLEANRVAVDALIAQSIDACREAYVNGTVSEAVGRLAYARKLNATLGDDWHNVKEKGAVGDNQKAVQARVVEEKEAFYALMYTKGHSNPTVAWKQMKARCSKMPETAGDIGDDKLSRGTPTKQAWDAKCKLEAKRAYKRVFNAKANEIKEELRTELNRHYAAIYTALGGDLAALNEGLVN